MLCFFMRRGRSAGRNVTICFVLGIKVARESLKRRMSTYCLASFVHTQLKHLLRCDRQYESSASRQPETRLGIYRLLKRGGTDI